MKVDTRKMDATCPHCDGSGEVDPTVSSRLLWMRKQIGLNQADVADAIGISRPALANMEAGKQNLTQQNIRLFCRYFEVSSDWLLGI